MQFMGAIFQAKSLTTEEIKTRDVCHSSEKKRRGRNNEDIHFADWRYGAAKIWYDKMNIPDDSKDFSLGFKLKEEVKYK